MALTQELLQQIANNQNFTDKELLTEISELLKDKPEASEYLYLYGQLCEMMDDLVDEEKCVETVDKVGTLRMQLSTCSYWLKNWTHLWMTERLIHHQYFDMVKWEHSDEEWKRRDARAMNHCAYNMFFAVLQLEFGDEIVRKFSLRFREHAHNKHLNDPI